jgi:hypothetical protein
MSQVTDKIIFYFCDCYGVIVDADCYTTLAWVNKSTRQRLKKVVDGGLSRGE